MRHNTHAHYINLNYLPPGSLCYWEEMRQRPHMRHLMKLFMLRWSQSLPDLLAIHIWPRKTIMCTVIHSYDVIVFLTSILSTEAFVWVMANLGVLV